MIQDIFFTTPILLWAIPVLLILGAFYIRTRARDKLLAVSRLAVFCLIIAAAANPYFVELQTVQSQKPSITILDDKTGSMEVFDPDVAARLSTIFDAAGALIFRRCNPFGRQDPAVCSAGRDDSPGIRRLQQ